MAEADDKLEPMTRSERKKPEPAVLASSTWQCGCGHIVLAHVRYCVACGVVMRPHG